MAGGVHAQSDISVSQQALDSSTYQLHFVGEFNLNSTVLNNRFFGGFSQGGFIDRSTREAISERLLTNNRTGGDLSYGFGYGQRIGNLWGCKPYSASWFINITDRQHFDTRFNKDLFDLTMFGNKQFAGDTAHMGDAELNFWRYQQFEVGLVNDNGMGQTYGASISLIKGEEYRHLIAEQLDLYTSDIGDELGLDTRFESTQSDTANKGFDAFHGFGFSTNLFYEYNFNAADLHPNRAGLLQIEIRDLGFVYWNANTLHQSMDTALNFQGIVIQDIFDVHDSLIQESIDSLQNAANLSSFKSDDTQWLPALFSMKVIQDYSKHQLHVGLNYRINANYAPQIFIQEAYKLKNNIMAGARVGYGGYGRLNFGILAQYAHRYFDLLIGSNHLEGLILPKQFGGNNAYVSVRAHL